MRLIGQLLAIPLWLFGSWTIAYQLVVLLKLPAETAFWLATVIAIVLGIPLGRSRSKFSVDRRERGPLALVLILGLLTGFELACIGTQDNDDYSVFHRAIVFADHLHEPVTRLHTGSTDADLPALSPLHVLTSYEPMVAVFGKLTGVGMLRAFDNLGPIFVGLLFPAIMYALSRFFRLSPSKAAWTAAGSLLFLIYDGRPLRAYGVLFLTLQQGKVVLWLALIPLVLWFGFRYLNRPCMANWLAVFLCSVASVGLSNAGLYMLPFELLLISVAFLVVHRRRGHLWKRTILLNLTSAYPALFAAIVLVGMMPMPKDMNVWDAGWPHDWWANLVLLTNGGFQTLRDALLIFGGVVLAVPKPLARPLLVYCALPMLCFTNAVVGPFWLKELHAGSYWRILLLYPAPWCAGLMLAGVIDLAKKQALDRAAFARWAIVAATLLLLVKTYQGISLRFPSVGVHQPFEYRFDPFILRFGEDSIQYLHGHKLLADEDVTCALGLLDPSIQMVAGRPMEITHFYTNAGRPTEGEQRNLAQSFLKGDMRPEAMQAFTAIALSEANAIVAKSAMVPSLKLELDSRWHVAFHDQDYVLLLKQ